MVKKKTDMAIKYGMEGREIENCQKLLQKLGSKITVNGKFTVGMISAVRAFQKKHDLKVTGEIDVETMKVLKECAKKAKK